MAAKKSVGTLIREARTAAGLSQTTLASLVEGLSATDLGKAERGEKELTAAQLKALAKPLGVTQKSLLEAAGLAKPASTAAKTSAKSSAAKTGETLTAAEKKLLAAYRAADADRKKAALQLLTGETSGSQDILEDLIGSALGLITRK